MGVAMQEDQEYLTVEEAGEKYDVSPKTVHYWIKQGKIKKYQRKLDGAIFVKKSEIDEARAIRPVDEE